MTVIAVGVSCAGGIHGWLIDAPLEAVGMIVDARDRAVRLPGAALRVGVHERPLEREAMSIEMMEICPKSSTRPMEMLDTALPWPQVFATD